MGALLLLGMTMPPCCRSAIDNELILCMHVPGAPRRARQLRLDQHWVVGKSVASNTQGTKDHMIAELFEAVRHFS